MCRRWSSTRRTTTTCGPPPPPTPTTPTLMTSTWAWRTAATRTTRTTPRACAGSRRPHPRTSWRARSASGADITSLGPGPAPDTGSRRPAPRARTGAARPGAEAEWRPRPPHITATAPRARARPLAAGSAEARTGLTPGCGAGRTEGGAGADPGAEARPGQTGTGFTTTQPSRFLHSIPQVRPQEELQQRQQPEQLGVEQVPESAAPAHAALLLVLLQPLLLALALPQQHAARHPAPRS